MIRPAAAACLLAIALGACTGSGQDVVTPAPSPPPSTTPAAVTSAGVVLPARGRISEATANRLRRAVEQVVRAVDPEIALRVVQPDGPEFAADLAGLLAEDGFDLVCTLGAGQPAIVALATQRPGTRFCMMGPVDTPPPNLWAPALRHREAAWLAGVAAAIVGRGGRVGKVVREGQPALAAKQASFELGYAAAAEPLEAGEEPIPPTVGTIALQDQQPLLVVDAVLSQEPRVLVIDVGPLTDDVVQRIADAGTTPVIAWTGATRELEAPAGSVLIVTQPVAAFRLALEADLAGAWEGLPDSIGLSDGAFVIRRADRDEVPASLQPWIDEVIAGRVDVGGGR